MTMGACVENMHPVLTKAPSPIEIRLLPIHTPGEIRLRSAFAPYTLSRRQRIGIGISDELMIVFSTMSRQRPGHQERSLDMGSVYPRRRRAGRARPRDKVAPLRLRHQCRETKALSTVREQVAKVLDADACSGCGVCTILDRGLSMELDDAGYLRPVPAGPADERDGAARIFTRACPGRRVVAKRPPGSVRHPLLGSYFGVWEAWAVDPEVRHRGSSGGVLTAIQGWLLASGIIPQLSTAAADAERPVRTVPVRIVSKAEALASAGSRYAPVSVGRLATPDPSHAVTAKPCEVSAIRALTDGDAGSTPILLSFFCAGTPSQHATEQLVRDLGGPEPDRITDLWYRGRGWPGRFTAVFDGGEVSADYDHSWGAALGPTTQWRCKICPDGVGESADIAAADSWETDERGYPTFGEKEGRSALLARTERGLAIVLAAHEAGAIELRPLDPARLAQAQPLQTSRRRYLAARLWGARFGGRAVPRYRGFNLIRLSAASPRLALRALRGTLRRIREAKRRSTG